jgi:hypothetical protein
LDFPGLIEGEGIGQLATHPSADARYEQNWRDKTGRRDMSDFNELGQKYIAK